MSKKLFTKLELASPHAESERAVADLLESIVSTSADRFQEGQIKKLSKQMLTRQIMYREVNSVGQAFPTNPFQGPLREDQAQKLQVREGSRPFSAKIEKVYHQNQSRSSSKKSIYGPFKRNSARSSYKYSMCQSTKSREPKRYGIFRPNNDKFFPLQPEKSEEDTLEQAFIDSLRQRKAQEQAYQRSKEKFLKTTAEQGEKYGKLNKKFLQAMGSKNYYYNKNGQTVELAHPSRLVKKAASNRTSARQEQTRRGNEVRSELTVEYQQKQNYFKRTREAFQIDARPPVLFYKSEQCKYQIIA